MWKEKTKRDESNSQELMDKINSLEKRLNQFMEAEKEKKLSERYLDIKSACRYLGMGRTTLYELMNKGEIAYTYIGKNRRMLISDLDKYTRRKYVPIKESIL